MTTGGQGGFTSGEDFIAAKVSIDVPTEGLQNIKELSAGLERFRTIVEASARSSSTYVGYLQQMTQAANMATEAHLKMAQQLETTAQLQQRAMTGLPGASQALPLSRSAPQGFVDNFSGMGVGMGMGGIRGGSPSDVPSQLQMANYVQTGYGNNPQQYVYAQAGRNRTVPGVPIGPTGAPDWRTQADSVQLRDQQQAAQAQQTPDGSSVVRQQLGGGHGGGLTHNLINEMAVGGNALGVARHVASAIGSRGAATSGENAEKEISGGKGFFSGFPGAGLLSKMGPAGMIAGAGLAGLGLVERGGGMFQDYKNLGSIRGGGAAEGFQTEMGIRSLALNPFLSNDQARQIVMAGLTEGYSGKQYDDATKFMADNLKNMNMQVSDSVGLLRKNVVEGGQSITGLAAQLGTLKEMTKTGALSLPDAKAMFAQTSGSLIGRGLSGGAAGQAANEAIGVWSGDELLKGNFAAMVQGAAETPLGGAMLEQYGDFQAAGLPPDMLVAAMDEAGVDPSKDMMSALKRMVDQMFRNVPNSGPRFLTRVRMFQQQVQRMTGQGIDTRTAIAMVKKLRSGDPFTGSDKASQVSQQVGGAESLGGHMAASFGAMGRSILDIGKGFAGWLTNNPTAEDNARDDMNSVWDTVNYNANAQASNPTISSIVGQFGAGDIEVGNGGDFSALTGSREQVQGLASGKLNWRRKGEQGGGISLAQTGNLTSDFRTGGGGGGKTDVGVSFQPATVNIKVDQHGVTASPNPVQLTPNQQQVNAGYGSNTMNNPQPGDGYGYYRGRMANGIS